jgi:hypothetical protein
MPACLILLLCVVALCLPAAAGVRAAAAPPSPSGWQAVLVAGDNAEPVFDNAVAAVARWLASRGVPTHDIHRLSATQRAGDAAAAEPASPERILNRIAALRPRRDEGCFVFVTSHGHRGEGIWLAYSGEFLRPAELARALSAGCAGVPTVVVVSGCFSGAFTAMRAPNRIVVTAARSDRPSFGCQADRTYTVFDECLLGALQHSATWRAVYKATNGCVRRRERDMGVVPSQPQASFGAAVRNLAVR